MFAFTFKKRVICSHDQYHSGAHGCFSPQRCPNGREDGEWRKCSHGQRE